MTRALWLLMRLRLRGWGRRMVRQVQTVRGAIVTIFFGLLMMFWLCGLMSQAIFLPRAPGSTLAPEHVERYGPLVLLAYCIGMLVTGGGQTPLQFTLPEVQFLFSGPFSRRQILTYKLLSQFLLTIPLSLFVAFAARAVAGTFLSGLVAALLVFPFLQLYGTATAMIVCTADELLYSRARRVILVILAVAFGVAVMVGLRSVGTDDPVQLLLRIEQSDVVQYGLMPLRWFARTLAARSLDGTFLLNAGLALAVNLGLLAVVYALDAQYLESAATAAEKRYARLERLRSGGLAGLSAARSGKVGYRVPGPPWLGGVGPIVWRQLISAYRSKRVLGILIFTTLLSCLGPVIAMLSGKKETEQMMPWLIAGMGLFMSLMLSHTLAFDFRSDVDRIEVLKNLPIPGWRIVVGQLLTPTLCITLYQILLLTLVYLMLGHIKVLLMFAVVLAWPVNLLLTGIDNLLFLLFPTRMAPANPGDFSQAGRQMLMMLGKGLGMMVGLGFPAAFGGITYATTGSWGLTLLVAFIPAALICLVPVPLMTMAFNRFDVARDTPP